MWFFVVIMDENVFRGSLALAKFARSPKDRLWPSRDLDCTPHVANKVTKAEGVRPRLKSKQFFKARYKFFVIPNFTPWHLLGDQSAYQVEF